MGRGIDRVRLGGVFGRRVETRDQMRTPPDVRVCLEDNEFDTAVRHSQLCSRGRLRGSRAGDAAAEKAGNRGQLAARRGQPGGNRARCGEQRGSRGERVTAAAAVVSLLTKCTYL